MEKRLLKIWEFVREINIPDVIFAVVILVLVILPNTKLDKSEYDYVEKRPLATFPKLIKDGEINREFGKQFESFYNDRFRNREICIDKNLIIKGFINQRTENHIVLRGRHGWMFYKGDNSIANYQNKVLFSDSELLKIKHNLEVLNDWCNRNEIKLIVIIPPDKNRIYGEYYPKNIKKINPKSRVELLREFLDENSNIKIIYPVEQMYERKKIDKEPLYYHTDTHWTQTGSYVAYNEIFKQIAREHPYLQNVDCNKLRTERKNYSGDCTINPKKKKSDFTYLFYDEPVLKYTIKKYDLKIAIIGDSFSGELSRWLSKSFDVQYNQYNKTVEQFNAFSIKNWEDRILSYNPDVLIIEFVERYADKLLDLYKE